MTKIVLGKSDLEKAVISLANVHRGRAIRNPTVSWVYVNGRIAGAEVDTVDNLAYQTETHKIQA